MTKTEFTQFCQACKGKCCHIKGHIPISNHEAKFIKKNFPKVKTRIFTSPHGKALGIDIKEKCPFVNQDGCILNKNRFLSCKLWPLIFTYKNNTINFLLFNDHNYCPYLQEIQNLKSWQENAKKLALKELKSWTESEKYYFSDLSESIKNNNIN